MVQLLILDLELGHVLLPDLLDRVQSVGEPEDGEKSSRSARTRTNAIDSRTREEGGDEPGGLKDLIELFLERSRFTERPVGLLLMAEDDVVEDSLRDSEQSRDLRVDLAALGRDGVPLRRERRGRREDPLDTEGENKGLDTDLVVPSLVLVLRKHSLQRLHAQPGLLRGDL